MPHNIRIVSTCPPRKCGVGTFSRDLANALGHFTGEVGHIRVAAIDKDKLQYNISRAKSEEPLRLAGPFFRPEIRVAHLRTVF